MEENRNNIKPKFLNLWPTQFMEMSLPGHETANPVIADIVLSNNADEDNMTENYVSQNILNMDHPAMYWLKQCLDRAIYDYAIQSGINYELKWSVQGWGNVNMKGTIITFTIILIHGYLGLTILMFQINLMLKFFVQI